jgi:hypothetical protein
MLRLKIDFVAFLTEWFDSQILRSGCKKRELSDFSTMLSAKNV